MSNNIADNRNAQSMQIILHAGNAREAYTKALDLAESGNFCDADSLLKEAETELTQAHRLQTRILQDAIEEDDPCIPILLIHAQDMMMSIDSEYRMACRFISLYRKLNTTEENS